jgi:hypothetical protein
VKIVKFFLSQAVPSLQLQLFMVLELELVNLPPSTLSQSLILTTSGEYGAGIGGCEFSTLNALTIINSTIAASGYDSAGIGGARSSTLHTL